MKRPLAAAAVAMFAGGALAGDPPPGLEREFPRADFSIAAVDWSEIRSGGPPRDGIPSIDAPEFVSVEEAAASLSPTEPVVGLIVGDDARAYPLRILIWHEIVNDIVGGAPVAVTYCPLCNTAVVFDRRVAGEVLDFGVTGRLRNSDLIMYDRQTESWWQQFLGEAIVGAMTGRMLDMIPARLESFANFRSRAPGGKVLAASSGRNYGANPYPGYDSTPRPFLYDGPLPRGVAPLARVVRVGAEAWSLALLRASGAVVAGDVRLSWTPGQNSAVDAASVAEGVDVGNVTAMRRGADGVWRDIPYSVDFAFAFAAFYPDSPIHVR